jgi:hypothetical protein
MSTKLMWAVVLHDDAQILADGIEGATKLAKLAPNSTNMAPTSTKLAASSGWGALCLLEGYSPSLSLPPPSEISA